MYSRVLGGLCAIAVAGVALNAQAPDTRRPTSVKDGLYSAEQATRGRAAYERACAECHMPDLAGHEYAGALAGYGFQLKWQDASVAELYGRIRSMPLGRPGWLTSQEYLDILAYVLQKNGYPEGQNELTGAVAGQSRPRIPIERTAR
ncbi:MAG: c-type cytochrome [Vicinamibacterales bacterium]